MRYLAMLCLLAAAISLQAQKNSVPNFSKDSFVITNLERDTVKERDRASLALRNLINGSVIVRLKTNQKSIDAYRKAGKVELADKIDAENRQRNLRIYSAFTNNFSFCKVYFIYANETDLFFNKRRDIFLNRNLEHDASIAFNDTNFVFCEYGSVEPYSKFTDDPQSPEMNRGAIRPRGAFSSDLYTILDTVPTQTSTSPVYGFFFSDKDLKQFQRPFPYVEDTYFGAYDKAVRNLDRALHGAYERLVVRKDFRDMQKQQKKKYRESLKKSNEYHSTY